MMAAMAPVMSFLMMGRDMRAMAADRAAFLGRHVARRDRRLRRCLSVQRLAGREQLKHGLMTERPEPAGESSAVGAKKGAAGVAAAGTRWPEWIWGRAPRRWQPLRPPRRPLPANRAQPAVPRRALRRPPRQEMAEWIWGRATRRWRRVRPTCRPRSGATAQPSRRLGPAGCACRRYRDHAGDRHRGTSIFVNLRHRRRRCRWRDHAAGHDHDPRHAGRCDARHGGGRSARRQLPYTRRRCAAATRCWNRRSRTASRSSISNFGHRVEHPARCPVMAYAFNRQVPGPRIQLDRGRPRPHQLSSTTCPNRPPSIGTG